MRNSEAEALLAAVLADPDDDAPRLVYADWLDEHGQTDRGAFIRLQIELARLPQFDPRREVLTRKATRLLDLNQDDWLAELPRPDGITWGSFTRGFVSAVVARTYAQFARAADWIWAVAPVEALDLRGAVPQAGRTRAHPRLRAVRIRQVQRPGRVDEFIDSPLLSSVRTLDLTGLELEGHAIAHLARSPSLENLRELILDDNFVGIGGMVALAGSRAMDRLTRLSIRGFGGGADFLDPSVRSAGVEALATSFRFRHLEALDLTGNEIGDDALAALVQSPHLVNLRELTLAHNELTDAALEVLAEEGWEMRLGSLDLSGNAIGDAGVAHLGEAEVLSELVRLKLDRCDLGPRGARALAGADWFGGLSVLSLNDNSVGADGAAGIAGAGTSLGELRLRDNDLGLAGARRLAEARPLAGLYVLDVSANEIGAAGLKAIARSPNLTRLAVLDVARSNLPLGAERIEPAIAALADRARQLVWLRLDQNGLAAPGLLALVRAGEWTELAELGLRECGVNVPALAYLADHGRFPVLTRLALSANAVDSVGLRAFVGASFVSHLTHLDLNGNRIGTDGARLLAEADLGRLRWLSVELNGIGPAGLTALAKSTTLERLTTLKCLGNGSGDWWRLLRDRFPGDESWGEELLPDGEIPF